MTYNIHLFVFFFVFIFAPSFLLLKSIQFTFNWFRCGYLHKFVMISTEKERVREEKKSLN